MRPQWNAGYTGVREGLHTLKSEEHGTYLNSGDSISILLCNSRMIESGH